MSNISKEHKVEKIIVRQIDELIDLIGKMTRTDADRILLTFADESDLLYSPINLKVLQQIADENGKSLILQIVQNKPGVLNAQNAGVILTESTDEIGDEMWISAEEELKERIKENKDRLKGINKSKGDKKDKVEIVDHKKEGITLQEDVAAFPDDSSPVENTVENETHNDESLNDNSDTNDSSDTKNTEDEEEVLDIDTDRINAQKSTNITKSGQDLETETEQGKLRRDEQETEDTSENIHSSFQDKINEVLGKAKDDKVGGKGKVVEEGGFVVAIDDDISEINEKKNNQEIESQTKQDKFSAITNTDEPKTSKIQTANQNFKNSFKNIFNNKSEALQKEYKNKANEIDDELSPEQFNKTTGKQANSLIGRDFVTNKVALPKAINLSKESLEAEKPTRSIENEQERSLKKAKVISIPPEKNYKKLFLNMFLRVGLPVLALLAVSAFLAYSFLPLAKVKMYIESKAVSLEKTYTGEPGSVFNNDIGTIAVKLEEVKKERADTAGATGTGYRGNKASGVVTVKCFKTSGTVTLPSGTSLTTSDGKVYYLTVDVTLDCPDNMSAAIEAQYVGEEYNISSGQQFTVGSYSKTEVLADNSASITGGSKTAYKSVSQEDYDKLLNTLKQVTFDEATEELKEIKAVDGWVVIESTIKNELDGDPTVDYPVGTETDYFNISIKTKSSAIYYLTTDITDIQDDLLMAKAQELDLFNSSEEVGIQPLSNIESNITVEKVEGNLATIKVELSGLVMPEINKEDISANLAGKSWEEGISYLATLDYVTKPTEAEFTPSYFPRFLWHFPSGVNRIVITVEEVETEAIETATSTEENL